MKIKIIQVGIIIFFFHLFFVGVVFAQGVNPEEACRGRHIPGSSEYNNCVQRYRNSAASPVSGGGLTSISFDNPINANSLREVLIKLLTNLKGVVIIIAIIFIVVGGLMYMMSGGNEKTITRAKACVGGAIIGLAIVLAAPIFLTEILKIFGGARDLPTTDLPASPSLLQVVTKILDLLLSLLGIIAIITLVIGGGMYLTSYGDEKKNETAKKIVKYAIIGIVISLAAIVIVKEVGNLLGGNVTSPTTPTTPTAPMATTTPPAPTPTPNPSPPARGYMGV